MESARQLKAECRFLEYQRDKLLLQERFIIGEIKEIESDLENLKGKIKHLTSEN